MKFIKLLAENWDSISALVGSVLTAIAAGFKRSYDLKRIRRQSED